MFFPRTPWILTQFWPNRLWRMPANGGKRLYLTFDDGPTPDVTNWVLAQLAEWDAKATFFVVGDQVRRHPNLFREIVKCGHTVGNHSQTHKNGWKVDSETYLQDIAAGAATIAEQHPDQSRPVLYRPPYGRIRSRDARKLEAGTRIVMWDILAGDWIADFSREKVLDHVIGHARPGSLVVLHDSVKAEAHLRHVLPRVLAHFAGKGYEFHSL